MFLFFFWPVLAQLRAISKLESTIALMLFARTSFLELSTLFFPLAPFLPEFLFTSPILLFSLVYWLLSLPPKLLSFPGLAFAPLIWHTLPEQSYSHSWVQKLLYIDDSKLYYLQTGPTSLSRISGKLFYQLLHGHLYRDISQNHKLNMAKIVSIFPFLKAGSSPLINEPQIHNKPQSQKAEADAFPVPRTHAPFRILRLLAVRRV